MSGNGFLRAGVAACGLAVGLAAAPAVAASVSYTAIYGFKTFTGTLDGGQSSSAAPLQFSDSETFSSPTEGRSVSVVARSGPGGVGASSTHILTFGQGDRTEAIASLSAAFDICRKDQPGCVRPTTAIPVPVPNLVFDFNHAGDDNSRIILSGRVAVNNKIVYQAG